MSNLYVLDVGHGNCSLLISKENTVIFDCPPGPVLIATLDELGIKQIEAVFVSHSDEDHIGGITSLLSDKNKTIKKLFVNADGLKQSKAWKEFRYAAADSYSRSGTVVTGVNNTTPANDLAFGEFNVEIVSPPIEVALAGPGGEDKNGIKYDANALSIVARVMFQGKPWALLPGDMDDKTLETVQKSGRDIQSKILVFPHHGGLPGTGDPDAFAKNLCETVRPEVVVFSNGRDKHQNPRAEILRNVNARVACTQMSKTCLADTTGVKFPHLGKIPSKGAITGSCCAGSMAFSPNVELQTLEGHLKFVITSATARLCQKQNVSGKA